MVAGDPDDDVTAPAGLPRAPSGRVPQWVVDERSGVPSRHDQPWRADTRPLGSPFAEPRPLPPARRRERPVLRGVVSAVVAVGIGAAAVLVLDPASRLQPDVADTPAAPVDPVDPVTPPVEITIDAAAPSPPPGTPPAAPGPADTAAPAAPPPASDAPAAPVDPPSPTTTTWTNPDFPPPGVGASPTPLGGPVTAASTGTHAFTSLQDDGVTPVAYDPCRPVRYVVRPDNAPPEGDAVLREALAALSAATGLQFQDSGVTDEAPSTERKAYQPERYGQAWAPVLIAWGTPAEVPGLDGDVLGLAGSVSAKGKDLPAVYVSGTVYLDGPQLTEVYGDGSGRDTVRGTVEHELGHLVGLAHVDDKAQLMYPESDGSINDYQAGDLEGLARLGAGACVPQL